MSNTNQPNSKVDSPDKLAEDVTHVVEAPAILEGHTEAENPEQFHQVNPDGSKTIFVPNHKDNAK